MYRLFKGGYDRCDLISIVSKAFFVTVVLSDLLVAEVFQGGCCNLYAVQQEVY